MGIKFEMNFDVDEITAKAKDIAEKKVQDKLNQYTGEFIAEGMDPEQATEAAIAKFKSEYGSGISDSVE